LTKKFSLKEIFPIMRGEWTHQRLERLEIVERRSLTDKPIAQQPARKRGQGLSVLSIIAGNEPALLKVLTPFQAGC
jgi:hypothetical protein